MGFDGRFDPFGTCYLPPSLEALLEDDNARLGQGYLYGLQDLLLREAEIKGHPDVALDVPLTRPHHREADYKEQLLGLAVEPALF